MEGKMGLSEDKTERNGNWNNDAQQCVENSLKKGRIPESESQRSSSSEQATDPNCSAAEESSSSDQSSEGLNTSDSDSSDDGDFALLGVRSRATESSSGDSPDDTGASEVDEQETDPPPLATMKDGAAPDPMEPQASGRMRGQWEIPLSVHPHIIPTDALARSSAAPVQEPVRGRAQAPEENSNTITAPAAQTQQEPYDLLADFPCLQPPMKPLAWGELHDGSAKAKDAKGKGVIQQANDGQETGALHQSRRTNAPHEVPSICARDHKSALDLQTLGCETNNQPSPKGVAGTDGVGVNARSWACAAKAGMKQAAAPPEKARPCSVRQIVTINTAKVTTLSHPNTVSPLVTSNYQHGGAYMAGPRSSPWPCSPKTFVQPVYPPTHQHLGALAPGRPSCPPLCMPPPGFQVWYLPAAVPFPVQTSLASGCFFHL